MARTTKRFRVRIASAFLAVMLAAQWLLAVEACALPAPNLAMAFGNVEMTDGCGALSKNACLMASLRTDQTSARFDASAPTPDGASVAPASTVRQPSPHASGARWEHPRQAAAGPPPHILFCRLLT